MIQKTDVEGCVMNDQLCTIDIRQEVADDVFESWLVSQEFIADAMHFYGAGVDFPIGLQILV